MVELLGVIGIFVLLAVMSSLYGYDSRDGIDSAEPWRYGVWLDDARSRRDGLMRAITPAPPRARAEARPGFQGVARPLSLPVAIAQGIIK